MRRAVRISIVTPTLNSERYFEECLSSIHDDQPADVEVQHIVVDGGSGDQTVEMAEAYPCEIIRDEDEGLFDAVNIGIRRADGDAVAFLPSDDGLLPGALATVADWYRNRRSEWMVAGIRWIDAESRKLADLPPPPTWMTLEMYASLRWNCLHQQSAFLTRQFHERIGEYDLSHAFAADYDLFARALRDHAFERIDRTIATYRRHAGSTSIRQRGALQAEADRIADTYGPTSRTSRRLYRTGLRLWFNGRNPAWYLAKRTGRAP